MSRKRSLIWEHFRIDPKDDKKALCVACGESISHGGTTAKNFNTSNLRYHLQQVHIAKFEELELKQEEEADKKAEEYEVKQRKTDARQLTLAEVKERKDLWNYGHPQHKKSLFSDAGIIDSNRRRCLLAERLEMLTFLKHNLKLTQPVKE